MIRKVYEMDMHYVNLNTNMSRFAEETELSKSYTEVDFDTSPSAEFNKVAGLCIKTREDEKGNVIGGLIDGGDTNTIVVSSTGAGKTRRVLAPYVLSCICAGHSFIAHDPKGELYGFYKSILKKKRYEIRILNLREPMKGDRLNLLEQPARLYREGKRGRAIEIVREIAYIIYKAVEDKNDMFWTETSINLFICYFIIAATIYDPEYVTLSSIYRIHIEGQEKKNIKTYLQIYLEEHKDELVYELGMPSVTAPNETRQSIFSVFSNAITRLISNEEIVDTMTQSTFDPGDFASEDKRIALFIITRDEASQTYGTIVSTWVDMIYTTLIDEAQHRANLRLPNTVHFVLDEFGNMESLVNINDYLTASRSRGIRFFIVLQSLAQLYIKYPKEVAHVLVGNSQNLVYMSSTDMGLVKIISERCGMTIDAYTKEKGLLLSPDRLTHLIKERGETLMLLDRHYPYVASLPDLSMYGLGNESLNIDIPAREQLVLKYGLFSKVVEEMVDKKVNKIMQGLDPIDKPPVDGNLKEINLKPVSSEQSDKMTLLEDMDEKELNDNIREFFDVLDEVMESE